MSRIQRLLYVVASILFAGTLALSAQAQPPAKNGPQATTLHSARDAIIRTIGAEKDSVAIVAAPESTVTVERINSNMNSSSHGGRNNEAVVIGPIVSQAIADKPAFKRVVVIRVQYLRRSSGLKDEVVDTIEFRKDATGKFQFHET